MWRGWRGTGLLRGSCRRVCWYPGSCSVGRTRKRWINVDGKIDEVVLRWFGHVERDRIAKRVYMGKSAGSRLVSGSQKSWIDSGNECLKKRGMDVGQARGMVHYRSDVGGLEGRMHGLRIARGMNP